MLDVLKIPPTELFALLVAIGFAAGLNLYATVGVLGLLARFGHLPLPPGLQVLQSWAVIAGSTALFAIEFFADKIPAFDLIWNALHTFIRVPVAGLLAYRATSSFVIRAGFGIALDPYDIAGRGVRTNYPLMIAQNFQGANTYTPVGNWAQGKGVRRPPDAISTAAPDARPAVPRPSGVAVRRADCRVRRGAVGLTLDRNR